ncbi:hypothetical protein JM83_1689 [Gillisia sp. Hel_I_86]|uniref:hypothetical protein n=1 Tax=Gillisia sp. Hel_I_86 TaxID=1249981 RepID=UPI001199D04C|nr:hypothetical protein [Gillisia sp. Hel_I_86]TVZ26702.1 hypothetical protein JM83_1689 [Gillisia sp. Hel_I_86]
MKQIFLLVIFIFFSLGLKAQSCEELIDFVKSNDYGTTYNSPLSEAISKVSFHKVFIDFDTYYFAIVCFKSKYSYGCNEYLYQVGSNTKLNYTMNYLDSAGKAFWKYIQPYHENLECSPSLNRYRKNHLA